MPSRYQISVNVSTGTPHLAASPSPGNPYVETQVPHGLHQGAVLPTKVPAPKGPVSSPEDQDFVLVENEICSEHCSQHVSIHFSPTVAASFS